MKNLPLAVALTYATWATYQLGPILNSPMTLEIAVQGITVVLAWALVKVADVWTPRDNEGF